MALDERIDEVMAKLREHPEWKEPVQLYLARQSLAEIRKEADQISDMGGEAAEVADRIQEGIRSLELELLALWSTAMKRVESSAGSEAEPQAGSTEALPEEGS